RLERFRSAFAITCVPCNRLIFLVFLVYGTRIMKKFNGVNITQRARRRKLKDGSLVARDQWFANFNDPKTGKRRIIAFDRKKDAEAYKIALLLKVAEGSVFIDERKAPTVAQAI